MSSFVMDVYEQAAEKIIKEQEEVIGPLAWEQAAKVSGLKVDRQSHSVAVSGNKENALDNLIKQYQTLFGQTSVEVSKEAVGALVSQFPPQAVPSLLR